MFTRSKRRTNLTTDDRGFVWNLEAVAGAVAGRRQVEANEVNRRVEVTTTADKLEQVLYCRSLRYCSGDALSTAVNRYLTKLL